MYGWRARVGLMLPYDNTVIEPEFARTAPYGVSFPALRSTQVDRKAWAANSLELAGGMAHLGVRMVLYACSASSFMQGKAWHDAFLADFERAVGVPAETSNSAMVKMLHAAGARRVTLVTPYPEWLLEPLRAFMTDNGFDVAANVGLGLEPPDINRLGPDAAYRFAMESDVPDSDAVFILATNFRTLEILQTLQADLGKPVMSSNQALMWAARERLGLGPDSRDAPERWPSLAPCAARAERLAVSGGAA